MKDEPEKTQSEEQAEGLIHLSSFILTMSLYFDANAYAGLH